MNRLPLGAEKLIAEARIEPKLEIGGVGFTIGSIGWSLEWGRTPRPTAIITKPSSSAAKPESNETADRPYLSKLDFHVLFPTEEGTYIFPQRFELYTRELREDIAEVLEKHENTPDNEFYLLHLTSANEIAYHNYKIFSRNPNNKEMQQIRSFLDGSDVKVPKLRRSEIWLIDVVHENLPLQTYFLAPSLQVVVKPKGERLITIEHSSEGISERHNYIFPWPPEKLGDGSFGVVYKLLDTGTPPVSYAIKILYDRQFHTASSVRSGASGREASDFRILDSNDNEGLSGFRFQYESKIADRLRSSFTKLGLQGDVSDYVCPRDATDAFWKSPACASLRQLYAAQGRDFNLSNYAIVMDYCDATLKDLLEKIWFASIDDNGEISISGDEISDLDARQYKSLLGYNFIDRLDFQERLRVLAPYISGLCQGLSLVHAAGQSHHDLKPANVFIKYNQNTFQVKLGDFSFAAPAIEQGTNVTYLKDAISTGTVHFRSPEQRDFADACEGIIMQSVPAVDLSRYVKCLEKAKCDFSVKDRLGTTDKIERMIHMSKAFFVRIRDPKFLSSDIKSGDVLVFPSDSRGAVRKVPAVMSFDFYSDIWIDVDLDKSGSEKISQLERLRRRFPDQEKTQIVIYRLPGRRADLFGVGAILFDFVTGGESPETFYEKLRAFDVPSEKLDGGQITIGNIMSNYRSFVQNGSFSSRSTDSDRLGLWHMFGVFEVQHQGVRQCAPEWLVEVVLECMMYHASDNLEKRYAAMLETDDAKKLAARRIFSPVDLLIEKLSAHMRELHADFGNDNLLISPPRSQEWKVLSRQLKSEMSPETAPGTEQEFSAKNGTIRKAIKRIEDGLKVLR